MTANPAKIKNVYTLPSLVSIKVKNEVDTIKLESQFVAVASATAVPIKWIGYISELIAQGVEENPIEKKAKYAIIENINKKCPRFCQSGSSLYNDKYIAYETNNKEVNTPGKVLKMTYLLPILSITNTAIVEPIAFVNANGIFKIIPSYSRSLIPSTVVPESIIIYGP